MSAVFADADLVSKVKWAVFVIAAAYVLKAIYTMYRRISAINKLPGAPYKFPQGTIYAHSTPAKHLAYIVKYMREAPRGACRFWLGPQPIAVLYTPEDIKKVVTQQAPKSTMIYRYVAPWLGPKSLLTLEGEDWKAMRHLLNPAFHKNLLKNYTKVIVETTEDFLPKVLNLAETPDVPVDMFDTFALLTLDVICRCAFSYESHCQINDKDGYASAISQITGLVIERVQTPKNILDAIYYRSDQGKKFKAVVRMAHDHAQKLIQKRKEELKDLTIDDISRNHRSTGRALLDFLDILLLSRDEKGQPLSDDEILHQCNTFLFAGHDTTSSALTWIMYQLSHHPEAQDKCREEILNVFGRDGEIEHDEFPKLKYTNACIKEVLRICPPIVGTARCIPEPVTLESGVTLEAGTTTALNIYAVHHNPTVWEDPDEFRPERFLSERRKEQQYMFLPFSVGNRNCIGNNFALNELRVVVSQVLRTVRVLPCDIKPIPRSQIVLRSENGVFVRFEKLYEE